MKIEGEGEGRKRKEGKGEKENIPRKGFYDVIMQLERYTHIYGHLNVEWEKN